MSNAAALEPAHPSEKRPLSLGVRLLIAIPMALVFGGLGAAIYMPAAFVGGMATDSCSGGGAYQLWEVWLLYAWPIVMAVAALLPPVLVVMGRRWRWVLFAIAAGAAAGLTWYLLWYVLLSLVC
jgi:hypothetical protein